MAAAVKRDNAAGNMPSRVRVETAPGKRVQNLLLVNPLAQDHWAQNPLLESLQAQCLRYIVRAGVGDNFTAQQNNLSIKESSLSVRNSREHNSVH